MKKFLNNKFSYLANYFFVLRRKKFYIYVKELLHNDNDIWEFYIISLERYD